MERENQYHSHSSRFINDGSVESSLISVPFNIIYKMVIKMKQLRELDHGWRQPDRQSPVLRDKWRVPSSIVWCWLGMTGTPGQPRLLNPPRVAEAKRNLWHHPTPGPRPRQSQDQQGEWPRGRGGELWDPYRTLNLNSNFYSAKIRPRSHASPHQAKYWIFCFKLC